MKSPKLQRWLDLLAALLRRRYPVTFEELIPDVPAYAAPGQKTESRRRTFERDKDELRAFGVPIETVPGPDAEVKAYQLRVRDFYLPYLTLRTDRPARPRKIDRYGYQSLPSLAFEPDELAAVAAAAARVRQLGDPLLAEHAESAMRKLACDLPVDAAGRDEPDTRLVPPRARASSELMVLLDGALRARKRVTFRYRSMGERRRRRARGGAVRALLSQPALVSRRPRPGRDHGQELPPQPDRRRQGEPGPPGTPDYEIPAGFDLRAHARSRQAWELGAGDAVVATVHFRSRTGAAAAAHRLGEEVPGHPDRRHFRVRRSDAFARWLLSFGGDLVPVSPGELVDEYRGLVRETLAHHRATLPPYRPTAVPPMTAAATNSAASSTSSRSSPTASRTGAACRGQVGVGPRRGAAGPASISERFEVPGGFVEGLQIFLEADEVSIVPNHFLRPMRLTRSELLRAGAGARHAPRRAAAGGAPRDRRRDRPARSRRSPSCRTRRSPTTSASPSSLRRGGPGAPAPPARGVPRAPQGAAHLPEGRRDGAVEPDHLPLRDRLRQRDVVRGGALREQRGDPDLPAGPGGGGGVAGCPLRVAPRLLARRGDRGRARRSRAAASGDAQGPLLAPDRPLDRGAGREAAGGGRLAHAWSTRWPTPTGRCGTCCSTGRTRGAGAGGGAGGGGAAAGVRWPRPERGHPERSEGSARARQRTSAAPWPAAPSSWCHSTGTISEAP